MVHPEIADSRGRDGIRHHAVQDQPELKMNRLLEQGPAVLEVERRESGERQGCMTLAK